MLWWYNIHGVWLTVHMQPYPPNGSLIGVDRSTIGSGASMVMHLTRNEAGINFPRSLCGAFWMACLCLGEHLLHFCWPLCHFSHEHIAPIQTITAFQSVVIKHRGTLFKTPMSFKALNHRNEWLSIRVWATGLSEIHLHLTVNHFLWWVIFSSTEFTHHKIRWGC